MERRILLKIAYDGTAYCGYQRQNNAKTVEGEINRVLTELIGVETMISGASRTDTGVHARCNYAIFDTKHQMPAEKFSYALNTRLPSDIRIIDSVEVDKSFHPRKCDTRKTYLYRIDNEIFPDPMKRLYTHHVYGKMDIEAMNKAASYLVGEKDFASFCSANSSAETTVRTIYKAYVEVVREEKSIIKSEKEIMASGKKLRTSEKELETFEKELETSETEYDNEIYFYIEGNGFLYNMVRIIVGTLIEVGQGKRKPEQMREILEGRNRYLAGPTAPAKGLQLYDFKFDEEVPVVR